MGQGHLGFKPELDNNQIAEFHLFQLNVCAWED